MSGYEAPYPKEQAAVQKKVPASRHCSHEQEALRRDAFWLSALESPSLLFWIVTHLPDRKQYPLV